MERTNNKVGTVLKEHKLETTFTAHKKIYNISTNAQMKINLEKQGVFKNPSEVSM